MDKKYLEQIFSNDYPGVDFFIKEIIRPIFGDDIEMLNVDELENPDYKSRAQLAGIKKLTYVCDIEDKNLNSETIRLFDITLDDAVNIESNRVKIQQLARSIAVNFSHVLMLFHHENVRDDQWRFSYAFKASNNTDKETTPASRFTYVFGKGYRGRTAAERFMVLADSKRTNADFLKAFSVEALSDDFFYAYREKYANFVEYITGMRVEKVKGSYEEVPKREPSPLFQTTFNGDGKVARDYIKKMFGRIVFLYFLQRKGWLYDNEGKSNPHYMRDLFVNSDCKDNFLDGCLETLFFNVLNTPIAERDDAARAIPGGLFIPYLNGGLFKQDAVDALCCTFPAEYFDDLFDFLDGFNFTIDENDEQDAEVGIDPEMLGRIFENLLEDNKNKGAYYTPKEIVEYMCKEAVTAYLQNGFQVEGKKLIREFIDTLNPEILTEEQRYKLVKKLVDLKVCDPAIGSGAFPMGIVNLLYRIIMVLRPESDATMLKRHILEHNIYGVDIEPGAVDIARLRFWLAMVVDENVPQPLPNLQFKIMQGNSLLESFDKVDLAALLGKAYKGEGAQRSTDDDYFEEERRILRQYISEYYNTSNHQRRDYLLERIKATVIRQMLAVMPEEKLVGLDVVANNQFFLWHTWFSDVFEKRGDKPGGFDIVIGNPPYIEAKKLKHIAYLLKKHYDVYSGTADMSIYFLELGMNMLAPGGVLSYITTNKFFNTGYGAPLRRLLLGNSLSKIINFEQVEVFKGILVSSVIVEVQKRAASDDNKFVYEKFYKLSADEFKAQFVERRGKFGSYPQEFLDENEWSFADASRLLLKRKLEENSTLLKDLPWVNVFRGVTTGYNPAFLIDSAQKSALTAQEPECASIIKPLLQGRNIRKWYYNFNNEHMIFTRKGYDIDSFEAIKNHLLNFYDDLKPKDPDIPSDEQSGRKPGKYQWFEILDNTAYYPHFEYPEKIIWGLTADKWAFTLDTEKHYLPSNGYILTSDTIPTKYILGLLNSKLMHHYFSYIGVMTAGGAYTLKAATIEALPFKVAEDTSTIEDLVDRILSAKGANPEADVESLEDEIDRFVYKLYGLDYNEVRLIDPDFILTEEEYDAL
ncbi:MAG: BREX-1 system adenine-specific DNA-methyltransferase PglX [Prevotella sp.]|nr:BREX-1 system adenine-specific DNA-methyltransferase PglX [Bacteroides sp.]MCM1446515.1 BREX-1 system adenine-specific DNA-methyltransferase PglX [Prevotella sp.]